MIEHDRPEFSALMYQLAEIYQTKLSDVQVGGYWLALVDLPLRDVKSGMFEAFRTCTFFPKPADIRRVAYSGEQERYIQKYRELAEPASADIRKDNLAKIHALLDGIAERREMSTPENDPEVLMYYEIGKTVIDHAAVEHARREAVAKVRKRYSRKEQAV